MIEMTSIIMEIILGRFKKAKKESRIGIQLYFMEMIIYKFIK